VIVIVCDPLKIERLTLLFEALRFHAAFEIRMSVGAVRDALAREHLDEEGHGHAC
jgi:hypothetical protein